MDIRLVKQEELDRLKWDSCIHYASNGSVVGYKWFLNNVTKDWDTLVEGDYESVMPLTWNKDALGRDVLRQPILIRELGIFSVHILSPKRIGAFLNAIPTDYQSIQIALNERNTFETNKSFQWNAKSNHQILLTDGYTVISKKYSKALKADLEAQQDHLIPISNIKPERLADFYRQHTRDRKQREEKFHAVQRIMYNAMHRGIGFTTGITDLQGNLLAANFFIYSHGKVLSFLPMETLAGAKVGALNMLFDLFIRSHAGRPLILDFNTSDNYPKEFGAKENQYFQIEKEERKWKFLDKIMG
ncbi:MAG: hypothetical protein AAF806_28715 [Bacteroidota bacterium]